MNRDYYFSFSEENTIGLRKGYLPLKIFEMGTYPLRFVLEFLLVVENGGSPFSGFESRVRRSSRDS